MIWKNETEFDVSFDQEDGSLELSSKLVSLPWEELEDIALWAVAQCIADYQMRGNPSLTYERSFQLACQRIALSPTHRMSSKHFKEVPKHWSENQSEGDENQRRLLRKVNKLFALSGSSNEEEASLAMQTAQEIMSKYNLSSEASKKGAETSRNKVRLTLYLPHKTHTDIVKRITMILDKHYFVTSVLSYYLDPNDGDYYASILIIGQRHNVLIAEHVFDFLMYKLEVLWKEARRSQNLPASNAKSYKLGIISGFRRKLDEQSEYRQKHLSKEEQGLVHLGEMDLEEHVARMFPDLGISSSRQTKVDPQAFEAGLSVGKNIKIDTPITNQSSHKAQVILLGK